MSRSSVLAETVKDILNTVEFSLDFTAVRNYQAYYTLKDLKTLTITVIAPTVEQSTISRVGNIDVITVDVIVQKQVNPTDVAEMDKLSNLVEEIAEHFRGTRCKKWVWLGTEIATPYDVKDLTEWRVFTAVVQLRYQIAWVK